MKFGKSLSEKVRDDWKEYAVDYKAMKQALPKDDDELFLAQGPSKHDSIPEDAYPQYWKLYNESLAAITLFYEEKSGSAKGEINTLESKVQKYRLSKLPGSTLSSNITGDDLMKQVADANTELEYVREFLSINYTACSKILKKYDKRTFSHLRETKLEELLRDKPFLDGNAMDGFIRKAQKMMNSLREIDGTTNTINTRKNGEGTDHGGSHGSLNASVCRKESGFIYEQTQIILDKLSNSPFFSKHKAKRIPHFLLEEIEFGSYLGEGEFSIVKEAKDFNVNDLCPICVLHQFKDSDRNMQASESPNENGDRDGGKKVLKLPEPPKFDNDLGIENFSMSISADGDVSDLDTAGFQDDHQEEDMEDVASKGFMKHHCLRNGSARYAIKQLKSTLTGTKRADGAIDLAIEAKFLSVLSHPNIIKLCGLGGTRGHPRSFIVLDRLYDTLDVKIKFWKEKESEYKGIFKKHKAQLNLLWNDRLLAGYDIARAIKYLHERDIIYRDLKPENIGFDVRGNAKLFDFGLAKELREEDKIEKDQYNASGRTGTRRYMAPEVVLCKYYGKPADVFSFSILLWEMLALSQPFKSYDYEKHAQLVVQKNKRPDVKKDWPVLIKNVVKRAWAPDPNGRPSFHQICNSLSGEFADSSNGLSRTERLMNDTLSSRELALSRK
mmetsp:Transcript_24735/g.36653  ORF Transcript_24735/g.36653 Transcript_24735/m.36653 type:complete len:668 (+) Transcript_24735:48-2051(+)